MRREAFTEEEIVGFWDRVNVGPTDECWLWKAGVDSGGYGSFWISRHSKKRGLVASRTAYIITHGAADGVVCHSCDTPACCNPAHLWLGTRRDNLVDMARKGRARGQALTHCVNGHEYTPTNTYWRPGKTACRDCRVCIRARVAASRKRRAA